MPTYNYLEDALPGEQAGPKVAGIPDGDNLFHRAEAIAAAATPAQLVRLTQQERDGLSGPSTAQELELNQEYAALTLAVPELLQALGEQPTAMQDGVTMEGAVQQVKGAAEAMQETTTAAVVLLAADLSADLDSVQEAVTSAREGSDEAARLEVRSVFYGINYLHTETVQQQAARRARKLLRQGRHERYLRALETQTGHSSRLPELATADPAQVAAPLPTGKTVKAKGPPTAKGVKP